MKTEELIGGGIIGLFTVGFFIIAGFLLGFFQTYVILDVAKLFELNFIKLTFIQAYGCIMIINFLQPIKKNNATTFTDILKSLGSRFILILVFWGLTYFAHLCLVVWG
jgi:asparagine N-glycosylation enzyme membrane subunit Stt3